MKRLFLLVPMLAGALVFSTNVAGAAIQLNNYTLNFTDAADADGIVYGSQAGLGIADLTDVDEWKLDDRSFVGFKDAPGDTIANGKKGVISTGDTFTDYIAFRILTFNDLGGNDITPLTYGAGPGRTHGLSGVIQATGTQIGPNNYVVNGISQFDLFFDAGTIGDPPATAFTRATYTSLATIVDGFNVESFSLIAGAGTNTGPLLPTGVLNLILAITDNLVDPSVPYDYFEKDFRKDDGTLYGSQPALHNLVFGIADTQNLLDSAVIVSELETYFGFDAGSTSGGGIYTGGDFDFGFSTTSEGSFNKAFVPEPASYVIWTVGLVGAALVRRVWRRRVQ